MAVTIDTLVEVDLTAPKGAPTELRSDNTTDADSIDSIVNTNCIPTTNSNNNNISLLSDLNTFISNQKLLHSARLPEVIDKGIQNASLFQQDRVIKGDVLTLSILNVRSCRQIVKASQTLDYFKFLDHDIIDLIETRHKLEKEM